ncbi:MAG: twin-arginine translocase TatA/TatE family subunit [Parvularculaceae bacterium]
MGAIGPWQIVIILLLGLLLFGGGGKISSIMGDFAKGIRAFRKGLQEEDKQIEDAAETTIDVSAADARTDSEAGADVGVEKAKQAKSAT